MRKIAFTAIAMVIGLWAAPASAYYTSTGTGAAATTAASVPRAAMVVASQTSEATVHVSWSEAATSLPVTHRVVRTSSSRTATICTTAGRSCDDAGVGPGSVSYVVVTSYRTWSTTSDPAAAITVIDHLPTIRSFTRIDPAANNLSSVTWQIDLSEPVTGLGISNFTLAASGPTAAALTSVTGSGSRWTLTASTGTGSGTLTPAFTSSTGVTDSTGNPIAAPFAGETYAIRPFFPTALTLANGGSNNRIDAGDTITIAFSTTIDPSSLCTAWTVAGDHSSTLFGNRIDSNVAAHTYRTLHRLGISTIDDVANCDRDELVGFLDRGGYVRYDYRMAARLLALADGADRLLPDGACTLGATHREPDHLRFALESLPGWGSVTTRSFLRELRGIWPGADLPVDPLAARAAEHLALGRTEGAFDSVDLGRCSMVAVVDVRDVESALVRVALAHHRSFDLCEARSPGRCELLSDDGVGRIALGSRRPATPDRSPARPRPTECA